MVNPSEYFGLPIIGYAKTPSIGGLSEGIYEVIKVIELLEPAGRSFMVNKWFTEYNRTPLYVVEQFGAVYEPKEI